MAQAQGSPLGQRTTAERRLRRRRPTGTLAFMIVGALAVLLAVAAGWFLWLPGYRPALGPGERYGIDVSSYQHRIDWHQVARQHVSFAYIKATEGAAWTDPRFAANWSGAGKAGILHGAYHFYSLCSSGAAQARNFLRVLPAAPGGLAPALDLELSGNCSRRPRVRSVAAQLGDFLRLVQRSIGQQVVLYLGSGFAQRYPLALYSRHPLWLRSILLRPSGNWAIWQVSSFARLSGIPTRVDLDVSRRVRRTAGVGAKRAITSAGERAASSQPGQDFSSCSLLMENYAVNDRADYPGRAAEPRATPDHIHPRRHSPAQPSRSSQPSEPPHRPRYSRQS